MRKIALALCLLLTVVAPITQSETVTLTPFGNGSYKTILEQQQGQPFILVLWSLTCSSCLKEMALLKTIAEQHPELAIVLISVDDFSDSEQVSQILERNRLIDMSNWLFAEANSAQLRYQIDPTWYGELPRTYFYKGTHERSAISGILSKQAYDLRIAEILP